MQVLFGKQLSFWHEMFTQEHPQSLKISQEYSPDFCRKQEDENVCAKTLPVDISTAFLTKFSHVFWP